MLRASGRTSSPLGGSRQLVGGGCRRSEYINSEYRKGEYREGKNRGVENGE